MMKHTLKWALAMLLCLQCVAHLQCGEQTREPMSVKMGCAKEALSLLPVIADHQGFFVAEGVEVEMVPFVSGKLAFQALLDGQVDLATSSEVPIVFQCFERTDFCIVSSIGRSDNEPRIVARKDSGILHPKDLTGKRIGTQKASAVHFFLSMFLIEQGIVEDQTILSFHNGKDLPNLLVQGKLDAFSMREPFVSQAREMLGENAVVFASEGLYSKTYNLVASRVLVSEKQAVLERVLRSLIRAETFAQDHKDASIDVGAKWLNMEREALAKLWPEVYLYVTLDQSLILSLEDEARWIRDNNLLPDKKNFPNFLQITDGRALGNVRPSVMRIAY